MVRSPLILVLLAAGPAACSALIGFEAFVGPNDGVVDAGLAQDASASGDTGAAVDAASGEGSVGDGGPPIVLLDAQSFADVTAVPPDAALGPGQVTLLEVPGSFKVSLAGDCNTLVARLWGAGGARSGTELGGPGGYAEGAFAVQQTESVDVRVGAAGGVAIATFRGGDAGTGPGTPAGGGGGFSELKVKGVTVLLAGGGGGACASSAGGAGGGAAGTAGTGPSAGQGGTQDGGGSGAGAPGGAGGAGGAFFGGVGSDSNAPNGDVSPGGGGGAGLFGGGGGGAAGGGAPCGGGGGGSGFVAVGPVVSGQTLVGANGEPPNPNEPARMVREAGVSDRPGLVILACQ